MADQNFRVKRGLEVGFGGTVMSSLPNGNIGIGETNPTAKLEINVSTAVTALDIQGSAGQLFNVTNNLTSGSIFSVNDVSGIPSIDVDADGTVQIAPYGSTEYVGVGLTNPTTKLDVAGAFKVSGISSFQNDVTIGASGTTTPAFFDVSTGNVGIGTATPTAKLDVNGGLNVSGIATFQSNVYLGDSDILYFGDGRDLRIYHDGNNSVIKDNGTGQLYIQTGGTVEFRDDAGVELNASFSPGTTGQRLYYQGDLKFQTTSAGAVVTGILTSTSFSGDGSNLTGTGFVPDADGNLIAGGNAGGSYDPSTGTACSNIFIGCNSGAQIDTGDYNAFFGWGSGEKNTTAGCNVFLGFRAGQCNSIGEQNIALGHNALGFGALHEGDQNIAIGVCAAYELEDGCKNIFLGTFAGLANTTGSCNTMIGLGVGRCAQTTGQDNNFFGNYAGKCASGSGTGNNFIGKCTGFENSTGSYNNFIGLYSGQCNTIGKCNDFIGALTGCTNTGGSYNSFFGMGAGRNNLTGNNNVFIGRNAGCSNDSDGNVFLGAFAGLNNNSGCYNVFVGYGAGTCNTIGCCNNFLGRDAGRSNTEGNFNVFLGQNAGNTNTTGCCNVAIGRDVELPSAIGNHQFAIGDGTNRWITGDSSFNVDIPNTLSKGGGSFKIDHPHPTKTNTHFLVHSFVEGPKMDLLYRGRVDLIAGTATVNIDEISNMTEGTFVLLNRDVQSFTTNETGWTAVKSTVSGNLLTITAQDSDCTDTISWMVIGERQDDIIKSLTMTDDDGNLIVEPLK